MNDDKNKKMSTNYKDYKYVYTGYDDFIKEHHLDKKEIKEEKEKIIHDHRNVFDFNNPNQHTHDYSFDFNNPNEHQHDYNFDFSQNKEKPKSEYKDKYGNVYKEKPKVTTNYNNQYSQKTTITRNKNANDAAKTIKLFIFFFFIFPFLITFIGAFIAMFSSMDNQTSYDYEEETIIISKSNSIDPINAFCDGIENRSFTEVYTYITDQELTFDGGITWRNIIYKDNNSNRTCGQNKTGTQLGSYALENLEEQFNTKYQTNKIISEAYKYSISEYQNSYYKDSYYITVGKIDNEWYLIKVQ